MLSCADRADRRCFHCVHADGPVEPGHDGNATMSPFSFKRFLAVLRKEWIQVRRDPFTLRMIILLPVLQLFLFGYAINADPKHLPAGLLSADHSRYERAIVAALRNTGYYDIRELASEAEAERGL